MRIEFLRAGGFAAPASTGHCTVELEHLAAGEAQELRSLVEHLDFASFVEQGPPRRVMPDSFSYRLLIQDGDRNHTIETSDGEMPVSLRPLIEWLSARSSRR
jgi:hypothetical protein